MSLAELVETFSAWTPPPRMPTLLRDDSIDASMCISISGRKPDSVDCLMVKRNTRGCRVAVHDRGLRQLIN